MDIQWYPGHMTRAKRQMQEDLKLVDVVIELLDARAPKSSQNPDIDEMAKNKFRMVLLNKADLADREENEKWRLAFQKKGRTAVLLDARKRDAMKRISDGIEDVCREKSKRDLARGIKNRPVRAMVVGIPNVGKSTFINSFAKRAAAKTGNTPGVTKGKQWIGITRSLDLLDTPGILWPKFSDPNVGLHLAMIGSVSDSILSKEELALQLISLLKGRYPGSLLHRYGVSESDELPAVLTGIALSRGCLLRGAEADTARAAGLLLEDFRNGSLGRITLESPEEENDAKTNG